MLPSDAPSSSHGQADGSTELADQHQPQPDEHTSLLNHASWPASSTFEPLSSALTQPPAPTHAAGLTVAAFTEQLQNSERTPLVMGIPASAGDVPMLPMPGVAALRAMQPVPKPSGGHVMPTELELSELAALLSVPQDKLKLQQQPSSSCILHRSVQARQVLQLPAGPHLLLFQTICSHAPSRMVHAHTYRRLHAPIVHVRTQSCDCECFCRFVTLVCYYL